MRAGGHRGEACARSRALAWPRCGTEKGRPLPIMWMRRSRARQDPLRTLPSEKACRGSGKASQSDGCQARVQRMPQMWQETSGARSLDLRPLRGQGQCREPGKGRKAPRGGKAQARFRAGKAVPARAAPPPARTPEVNGHMRQVWPCAGSARSNHLRDLRPKASRSGPGAPRACQGQRPALRRPRPRGEAKVRSGEQPPPGGSTPRCRKMHPLRTWRA